MDVVFQIILFVLPIVVAAVIVTRLMRFVRLIQEPEKLAELLTEGVRRVVADAGLDPEHLTPEQIQENPELQKLVQGDLRKALLGSLTGTRANPSQHRTKHLDLSSGGQSLPPAIDARRGSGSALRYAMLAILAAGVAAAVMLAR